MTSVGDQARNAGAAETLAGGGEMGALMRAYDWTATPLGPVETWPQALKTCVRLLLTSRQPMWLGWGQELTFLYNDPYRSIVGGKHPQALGQPTSVVWREIWADIEPRIRSALGGDEGTYDEALLLLMERHGYREETYYTFSYSPIPDDEGRVAGIFCANTDDTRRVIGERQLALLRDLAAGTAEARTVQDACALSIRGLETNPRDLPFAVIYLLDAQQHHASLHGTVRLARGHPAAPTSIALDDADAWPIADVIRSNAPCLVSDLEAAFGALPTGAWDRAPAQAVALPIVSSSQSGPLGVLIVGLNPYRLFDDDYRGFLGLVAGQIATAIAGARAYEEERRRAEALAELDRAKTAFFNNVSHEFRTPLTLMLGPLEDVLAAPDDAALVREQVSAAHRNSLRLLRLVNTLLDFSRVEGARMEAVYEPTDLAALTAELAGVFRSAVERAGLRLLVECPPLPQPVYVDREMWEKIVLNLLSNAFKFTLEGQIAVTLRAVDGQVTLAVRDTGTGIPAEELPHLFERFHRVRGARARTHEGTGIGLALVQDLVRLHGGEIGVQSTPGVGSTFTVTLLLGAAHLPAERIGAARTQVSTALGAAPYVEEALRWLPAAEQPPQPQIIADVSASDAAHLAAVDDTASRARVLLADDNADLRDYLTRLLAARYEVRAVANGAQAVQEARAQLPDLVLSDVMMPELDGFGLLRALRADPRTSAVPVVLLSARAGEESTVEGLQAGADDYLVKPFSARELLARVQTHVELARARAQVARLQRVTAALSAATTVEEVAEVTITHGLEALGATVGVVAVISDDGASFTNVRVTGYAPEVVAVWPRFSADAAVPIADAVRAREPVILASRAEHDARYPHLANVHSQVGDGALAAIPLLLRERAIGGLGLSFPQSRQFSAEERAVMGALGELCAQALERARLYEVERRAHAEAEAERQRLDEIFQQAPAMLAVLRGPEHVFDVANGLYQLSSGRTAADLIGRSIREAFPELADQGFYELLDEVYRTGRPYVASETLVRLHRAAEGLDDVYFTFTYQPLRDAAGAVEGIVVVAVDVTTQVQARQRTEELARQVQEERDRWRQVLDVLPVGVVIVDAHGRIEVLNQAGRDIVGIDTRGQPLPAIGEEADAGYRVRRLDGTPYPPPAVPLSRSLRGEEVHGDQQVHRHAVTGRETPLLVNSAPLRDADGAIVGAIAVFQDITALRELERAREEFLSSAAHDLKTPLTGIRGQAQLAQRRLARLDSPETARVLGQLTRIQEGADAMVALINELVDVARQEMGVGLDLHREPTDLVALVQGSVEAQRDASGRTIHLEAVVPELHGDVDAARIGRVVDNLLSNALKYSPPGSDIVVRLEQAAGADGPEAVLAVRDEGIGIPAADLPYIFDRFQRARNVAAHVQGTGIGLASARGIVEQHGGAIAVESTEGAGSAFTVRLPLQAP